MDTYVFGAVIEEDDSQFWAEVPDLPGCYGSGDTFMDAVKSISNGIETHLAAMLEDGIEIPRPTKVNCDWGEVVYVSAEPDEVELSLPSVTASQAAEILNVSKPRIYHLAKAGKLDGFKRGRTTWVTRASIDRYLGEPREAGRPRKTVAKA